MQMTKLLFLFFLILEVFYYDSFRSTQLNVYLRFIHYYAAEIYRTQIETNSSLIERISF